MANKSFLPDRVIRSGGEILCSKSDTLLPSDKETILGALLTFVLKPKKPGRGLRHGLHSFTCLLAPTLSLSQQEVGLTLVP